MLQAFNFHCHLIFTPFRLTIKSIFKSKIEWMTLS